MKTDEKLVQLRKLMEENNIDALVVPSSDPHHSEYLADYWQARQWLTGFTGSAGTAVVTRDHAILWTDFRYYIQAQTQVSGSQFQLFRQGEAGVPSFEKWLTDTLAPGQVICLDARLFSCSDIEKYDKQFKEKKIVLKTDVDPIGILWEDRPAMPSTQAFDFPVDFAGETRKSKIASIRKKMKAYNADWHIIATLDDIAWTLNLRGRDVHTNPVNIAFLVFTPGQTILCMDNNKISAELAKILAGDQVMLTGYHEVDDILSRIEKGRSVLIDPDNMNFHLRRCIPEHCRIIEKPNPAIAMKAVKNEVQIRHMDDTAVRDGVAVVNFLYWLETLPEGTPVSEVSAADVLFNFRKQQAHFFDNSFDPIMAYGDHAAMCHYSATPRTDVPIGDTGLFLTDSGGNYFTGTTDITRTICRGRPTRAETADYTRVLKAHISVAEAIFPKGTKGFQIDAFARRQLWREGADFGHGTGHGVGFFLSVHEGPARISPLSSDTPLEEGMLLTNEPGIYREGRYGIRLENMVLVSGAFENEFGEFFKFKNMTLCHFERDLMDLLLLSKKEIQWINDYHREVYERLSGSLDAGVLEWLRKKTRPL